MTKGLIGVVVTLFIIFLMMNAVETDNNRLRKLNTQFEHELRIYEARKRVK